MESPQFELEVFEGPLDLLLSLIAKNKVDIYDIPIALILEQYLAYLEQMRKLDMEIAGEFIVTASELMLIKSRMLLPKPESDVPEEDPRAKLAQALIEYKRAKEAASYLSGQYETYAGRFAKDTEIFDKSKMVPDEMDVDLLARAMNKMLQKNSELPRLAKESENAIQTLLKARVVPVSEKVYFVLRRLVKGDTPFDSLFDTVQSRSELVATFVAVLELVRVQRIQVNEEADGVTRLHLNPSHKRREGQSVESI